jgi:hypothetical protein
MFSFGKFFWHYTVAQKALHDATLYMAKAPLDEVRRGAAGELASYIVQRETAELDSGTKLSFASYCAYRTTDDSVAMTPGPCNGEFPLFGVQAALFMTIPDPFSFAQNGGGKRQFVLNVRMRHAGK